jgi:hypothetical protein
MAYVGIVNTPITNNSARYLFTITQALKDAGWRVMAWGGGATTGGYGPYTSTPYASDPLATEGAWVSQNAWKVMKEPSPGTREFCFLRGSTATGGIIKYSRASTFAFSGATPASAIVAPTTGTGGDGQVIVGSGNDATAINSAFQGTLLDSNAAILQVVASNTPINGVYGFWAFMYPNATALSTAFLLEPMAVGSASSADPDPCAIYTQVDSTRQIVGSYTYATGGWKCWYAYGQGQAYFYTAAACGYMAVNTLTTGGTTCYMPSFAGSQSPYDGTVPMYPFMLSGGVGQGNFCPKGLTASSVLFGVTQTVGDTFNLSGAEPRIVALTASAASSPFQIAFPWIPNQIPTQY